MYNFVVRLGSSLKKALNERSVEEQFVAMKVQLKELFSISFEWLCLTEVCRRGSREKGDRFPMSGGMFQPGKFLVMKSKVPFSGVLSWDEMLTSWFRVSDIKTWEHSLTLRIFTYYKRSDRFP